MEEALVGPFHIPQQSRRHKLRFTQQDDAFEFSLLSSQQPMTGGSGGGLNLSLSTHTRSAGAYNPSPVGPFTGYALILGRSRFLRPAQELLEDFCRGSGVSSEEAASKLLEESGSWFGNEEDDISRRCSNPSLISLLHEVRRMFPTSAAIIHMHFEFSEYERIASQNCSSRLQKVSWVNYSFMSLICWCHPCACKDVCGNEVGFGHLCD